MPDESPRLLSMDDAVRTLRRDPAFAALVRDAYLGPDVRGNADRFAASAEWSATRRLLEPWLSRATVVDLGAGSGIVSRALTESGASRVYAIEPDPSDELGRGAIRKLDAESRVTVIDAYGESIPLPDAEIDIVYARQVLHHSGNLIRLVAECARVLRPGGVLLAVREHVVDSDRQLQEFLASHPVHALAGGENAFALDQYMHAFELGGLRRLQVMGPLDTIINAFPMVRSEDELATLARLMLVHRLGAVGELAARLPGIQPLVRWRLAHALPGRLYAFLMQKPNDSSRPNTRKLAW